MTRYQEAEKQFVRALEHDPGRVSCYDRLARLRRIELRQIEPADNTIKEMVAKNPKSGLAYINRWRYVHEFAPPADDKDIRKGVELAPDDLEVLFTAAVASEQKPDAAAARLTARKVASSIPRTSRSRSACLASRQGKITSIELSRSCGRRTRPIPRLTWPSSWPRT